MDKPSNAAILNPREVSRGGDLGVRDEEVTAAIEVLEEGSAQLMLRFRFLDRALWSLTPSARNLEPGSRLATDGRSLAFAPLPLLERFQGSFEELMRDQLHVVMHCVFRHPFDDAKGDRETWDLACDIVAEEAAMGACGARVPSADDEERRAALEAICAAAGMLTPGRVYRVLRSLATAGGWAEGGPLPEWRRLFTRDSHALWPAYGTPLSYGADQNSDSDESEPRLDPPPDSNQGDECDDGRGSEGSDGDADQPDGSEERCEDGDERGEPDERDPDDVSRNRESWEEIARQMELDLETFSCEWGDDAGNLALSLTRVNRVKYDYADFLRRFTAPREEMRLNVDEFDYVYYTFGLSTYGNIPFIEPLEYKEENVLRDFVIAIDTSESVDVDLVRRFLEHTLTILESTLMAKHGANVRILQCDSRIQSDTCINNAADAAGFAEAFEVRGFGGTDFRPVFGYVEELRRKGEMGKPRGLIYFTDGLGTFPDKGPGYDVAFVFLDETGVMRPAVPPWATKLVLGEGDLDRSARQRMPSGAPRP